MHLGDLQSYRVHRIHRGRYIPGCHTGPTDEPSLTEPSPPATCVPFPLMGKGIPLTSLRASSLGRAPIQIIVVLSPSLFRYSSYHRTPL